MVLFTIRILSSLNPAANAVSVQAGRGFKIKTILSENSSFNRSSVTEESFPPPTGISAASLVSNLDFGKISLLFEMILTKSLNLSLSLYYLSLSITIYHWKKKQEVGRR